jgi:hypothetical protein
MTHEPIKMKARKMPSTVIMALDHLSQCLEEWGTLIPKPSHVDLIDSWKGDMKEYIQGIDESQLVEDLSAGLIEAFSEWEGDDFTEAVAHEKTYALMQRPQTSQRTADWYTEFKRCLTASELYKVFKAPRERGTLVLQKAGKLEMAGRGSNSTVLRSNMSPFDWGIYYEPLVKQIVEEHWDAIIHEVGRFVHLHDKRFAASPDGLIIRSKKHLDMGGHLIEIKCPKSREIGLKIPSEYFYQMQLQLEVTEVRACEYVEAKFEFVEEGFTKPESGWYGKVATVGCFNEEASDWLPCKYVYGPTRDLKWKPDLGLNEKVLEINIWKCEKIHHERVYRDKAWFDSLKPKLDEFWEDVKKGVEGNFQLPESSRKKKPVECLIQDDTEVSEKPSISV